MCLAAENGTGGGNASVPEPRRCAQEDEGRGAGDAPPAAVGDSRAVADAAEGPKQGHTHRVCSVLVRYVSLETMYHTRCIRLHFTNACFDRNGVSSYILPCHICVRHFRCFFISSFFGFFL